MRIISKFRDYYDAFRDFDRSRHNKVYERNTRRVKVLSSKLNVFKEVPAWIPDTSDYYRDKVIFIIAGKVVPLIIDTPKRTISALKKQYHFDGSELKKVTGVDTLFRTYPDMTDLNIEVGSPVIRLLPLRADDSNLIEIEIDTPLIDYGFSNYKDAYSMYQEIDNFITNVLVNDTMVALPLTDVEKLESKGFDKVVSFRNVKNKKIKK